MYVIFFQPYLIKTIVYFCSELVAGESNTNVSITCGYNTSEAFLNNNDMNDQDNDDNTGKSNKFKDHHSPFHRIR